MGEKEEGKKNASAKNAGGTTATLILSYDGAGNDGTMRIFTARPGEATVTPVGPAMVNHSLGFAYLLSLIHI